MVVTPNPSFNYLTTNIRKQHAFSCNNLRVHNNSTTWFSFSLARFFTYQKSPCQYTYFHVPLKNNAVLTDAGCMFVPKWLDHLQKFIYRMEIWITNALCSIKVVTNKLGFPCMGTFKSKKLNQQSLLKFHAQFAISLALHAYNICRPCSMKWTHLHQHLRKTGRQCSEFVDIIQKIQFKHLQIEDRSYIRMVTT